MEIELSKKTLSVIGIIILLMSLIVVYRSSYTELVDENKTCFSTEKKMLSTSITNASKLSSNTCDSKKNVLEGENKKNNASISEKIVNTISDEINIEPVEAILVEEKVFDNLTLSELTNKLNKSLKSTLANKGHIFANYTKETGLNPYLAVAIVLEETGCNHTCSVLVNTCNNVGGIKGSGNCGGYQGYSSIDEGIKSYLNFLYNNYYKKGLKTPENINPTYAENSDWAKKINNYIDYVKSR